MVPLHNTAQPLIFAAARCQHRRIDWDGWAVTPHAPAGCSVMVWHVDCCNEVSRQTPSGEGSSTECTQTRRIMSCPLDASYLC